MGLTKQQLEALNDSSFPNNTAGLITPQVLRDYNDAVIGNTVNQDTYTTDSASFSQRIGTGGNINTASFATTGSNTFVGDQTVTGSIIGNSNINIYSQFPGISLRGNSFGSGSQYPFAELVLDSEEYSSEGVIGAWVVADPSTSQSVGMGINTYTSVYGYPNPVPVIYGQGLLFGTDDTLIGFPAGKIDLWRNTDLHNNLIVSGTATFSELSGSLGAFSASISNRINNVSGSGGTINTSSLATTGSNTFNGNQTINGVVQISSSATYDLDITGAFQATAASRVSGSLGISTIGQTTVTVSSGSGTNLLNSIAARGYITVSSGSSNNIGLYSGLLPVGGFAGAKAGGGIAVSSGSAGNYYYPIEFQPTTAYTDGRVTFNTPISASAGIVGDTIISNGTLQVATYPQTGKTWFAPTAIEAVGTSSVAYEQFVDGGGYDCFNVVTTLDSGSEFRDLPSDTFILNTWLQIPRNTGNNPAPQFKRGLGITGSVNVSGSVIGANNLITTGSAGTYQTLLGGLNADLRYTASLVGGNSGSGGSNVLELSYDIFAYPEFGYWFEKNWDGVLVNGTGVTNATITGVGFGSNLELTLSSGTTTAGANYTITGPYFLGLNVTGSINSNFKVQVIPYDNSIHTIDNNGFTAVNDAAGVASQMQFGRTEVRQNNGNILGMLSTASVSPAPLDITYQGPFMYTAYNGEYKPMFGFQSQEQWTDGRITSLRSFEVSSSMDLYVHGHKQFNVGTFQSNINQSGSANVSQSMNFEQTDISNGVSIASNSRITLANAGVYNIQFSAQLLADTGADDVYIWLKKNGTNVSASAGRVALSNNQELIAAWNYVVDAAANDYYEIAWQSTNGDAILLAENASGNVPLIPSVILTVTQVR